ncbi:putative myo-inositol transporter [Rosellinia necatrix]|uniref:Putative myo-inositol transporter n=1 Tax=Rosellinia necatrix TaxID=77044 RepID=A0A1W2TV49_ROSNE|nr:putative myo-inositol transporter [Rosellinia necatrix]
MSEDVPRQTKSDRGDALSDAPTPPPGKAQDVILHAEHVESAEHADDLVKPITFDNSIDDTKPSRKVWTIIFTVAMGGFLFGYDTGYISAVLISIGSDLGHTLSSKEQELITSITSGGALIGALIAGLPADKFGRKFGIYIGCALFIAGSVIQATAFSVPQMTVGRFVVGLGVGSASMIVPLYIGEISVAKYRGRMVALNNVSVTFGQLISYVLGAGFVHVSHGWRYMVAIGGAPPILLAILLVGCPESPRLLLMHQKVEQARKALTSLYPLATEAQVQSKIDLLIYAIEEEAQIVGSRSLWTQFKELNGIPANLRALTTACGVMAVSQLCGFNTILYYGATLFSLVGFANPAAVSITIGATNFLFNIVNFSVIDRAGRRIVLLITLLGMALTMGVTAVAFHWIPVSKDLAPLNTSSNWASIVVLVTIILYIASFSSGVATISWVGTELLPIEVRAVGTVMINITCWGSNIIISSTFLSLLKALTPSGTFGLYAGICFFGWIFVIFCFPEVNGMPLEDIRQVFKHGFGVKTANKLQKEAAARRKNQEATV